MATDVRGTLKYSGTLVTAIRPSPSDPDDPDIFAGHLSSSWATAQPTYNSAAVEICVVNSPSYTEPSTGWATSVHAVIPSEVLWESSLQIFTSAVYLSTTLGRFESGNTSTTTAKVCEEN